MPLNAQSRKESQVFTRKEAIRLFGENQTLYRELLAKRLDEHMKEFRQITVAHFDVTSSMTLTVAERQHYAEDFLTAILPAVAADAVDAFLELLQLLDTQSER